MNNYPPGTYEGDPLAPWNAPEAEPLTCACCGYEAWRDEADGDDCPECGEGTLEEPVEAEPCRCTGDACYC